MRTVCLEVNHVDEGWTTVTFEDVKHLGAVGAPGAGDREVKLTLIGKREDSPNQVETGILAIADRHEALVDSGLIDLRKE